MNKFRNEKVIKLGDSEVLLRATFNNLAKTETEFGSIAKLAIQLANSKKAEDSQLPITLITKFFYLNQKNENQISLDDMFELCLEEGYPSIRSQLLEYFVLLTAGKKINEKMDNKTIQEQEKKV